jgi:uncharacterized protein YndB with AHSA1/START domain
MDARSSTEPSTSDREILITRTFDAPRELVFKAWTAPEHLGAWWGPDGFTTTTHEMDFRPGGAWRFTMHGPDGTDYKDKIVYKEIEAPARLAYVHSADDDQKQGPFQVTADFKEQGGKTTITFRLVFENAEDRAQALKFGAMEGANQTLSHLADHLTTMA